MHPVGVVGKVLYASASGHPALMSLEVCIVSN